jgi:hypothetical protein
LAEADEIDDNELTKLEQNEDQPTEIYARSGSGAYPASLPGDDDYKISPLRIPQ